MRALNWRGMRDHCDASQTKDSVSTEQSQQARREKPSVPCTDQDPEAGHKTATRVISVSWQSVRVSQHANEGWNG